VPPEEDAAFGKSQRQDGVSAPTYRGFSFAPERGLMPEQQLNSSDLFTGDADSRVIIHVPHAGLLIPEIEIPTFTLRAPELAVEARLMADIHTDLLAREVYRTSTLRPWVFINNLSRLVVDPERFADESEEMNAVGMGFAYKKTADQQHLRAVNEQLSERLLTSYYTPYSNAFAGLTRKVLGQQGRVTIIDLHSYAVEALPYELHKEEFRPAVCLGVDKFHTGWNLVEEARDALYELGTIEVNSPFKGSYVPLDFYVQDSRVQSIMFEIRKDTYGFGVAESDGFQSTVRGIRDFVGALSAIENISN
jgi:N-formylglutamate deformylase